MGRWLLASVSAVVVLFLAVPLLSVVVRWAESGVGLGLLGHPIAVNALILSMGTTFTSLALIIAFGTPLAYALARGRFPGRRVLQTLVDVPMVLPPAVAGLALLMAFGRRGLVGGLLSPLGIEIAFSTAAVVLAQCFVAGPLYVRSAAAAFARVDRDLEEVAAIFGASGWLVFRRITVPIVRTSLMGGAIVAWARALGEFGATILVAGNLMGRSQTMPLAIYSALEVDLDLALALAIVLMATAAALLLAIRALRTEA